MECPIVFAESRPYDSDEEDSNDCPQFGEELMWPGPGYNVIVDDAIPFQGLLRITRQGYVQVFVNQVFVTKVQFRDVL